MISRKVGPYDGARRRLPSRIFHDCESKAGNDRGRRESTEADDRLLLWATTFTFDEQQKGAPFLSFTPTIQLIPSYLSPQKQQAIHPPWVAQIQKASITVQRSTDPGRTNNLK